MANFMLFLKNKVNSAINSFSDNMEGSKTIVSAEDFKMGEPFDLDIDPLNGLCFNDIYLPEEVVIHILSFVDPKELLRCSLVCKHWSNLVKSNVVWQEVYNRLEYPKKALSLPWYIFYCYYNTENFNNLLKNGNGQDKFEYWKMDGVREFQIEKTPEGAPPLPVGNPDFRGCSSCYATSYQWCHKFQSIPLSQLMRYIILKHSPRLYVSEWYTGRFDCACVYILAVRCLKPTDKLITDDWNLESNDVPYLKVQKKAEIEQWANKDWEKLEIILDEYPPTTNKIVFGHAGKDKQFWAGYYGSKMAGGVVKFLIESIKS